MTLARSLFAATFSGTYSPEQHPRDAHGHFTKVTGGPADLRVMLREAASDPVSRAAAADRLEDLGRSHEASLLRSSEHPLLTIGGGVFATPGDPRRIIPQSVSVLTVRPTDRKAYSPGRFSKQTGTFQMVVAGQTHATALHAPSSGIHDDADPTSRHFVLTPAPRVPRGHAEQERVNAILERVMEHQLTADPGQLLSLKPAEEKLLAKWLSERPPRAGDSFRPDVNEPRRVSEVAPVASYDAALRASSFASMAHYPILTPGAEITRRARHPAGLALGYRLRVALRPLRDLYDSHPSTRVHGAISYANSEIDLMLRHHGFSGNRGDLAPSRRLLDRALARIPKIVEHYRQRVIDNQPFYPPPPDLS